MPLTWFRSNPQQTSYSTLQQGESETILVGEKEIVTKTSSLCSQIFLFLLLIVNTALLWVTVHIQHHGSLGSGTNHHGKLVKSPVPKCSSAPWRYVISKLISFSVPHETKTFELDHTFMDRPSEESNAAWELLGGRKDSQTLERPGS